MCNGGKFKVDGGIGQFMYRVHFRLKSKCERPSNQSEPSNSYSVTCLLESGGPNTNIGAAPRIYIRGPKPLTSRSLQNQHVCICNCKFTKTNLKCENYKLIELCAFAYVHSVMHVNM